MNPLLIAAALWMATAGKEAVPHRRLRPPTGGRCTPAWPGPGAPPPPPPPPFGPTPAGFRRVITQAPAGARRGIPVPPRAIPRMQMPGNLMSSIRNMFGGGGGARRSPSRPATPAEQVQRPATTQRENPPPGPIPAQARTAPAPRPAPARPAGRSAQAAASDLLAYFNAGRPLGTGNAPSAFVQAAQRDMGGIAADGIYGPQTRSRGQALIGKTFPPRTSQPGQSQGRMSTSQPTAPSYQGRGVTGDLYIP
jgi:hypothetical protein